MHTLREALRLALNTTLSNRQIGQMLGIAYNTVIRYRAIAREKNLEWPTIDAMDDTALEHCLRTAPHRWSTKRLPDWAHIHREMQLRDVTLQLLWEEYRLATIDDAYAYSQFTHLYREFVGKLDLTMRQAHRAGECVYVDFAGRTVPWTDRATGAEHQAQVFVGVLGCSNYTFVYAVPSQSVLDWIDAHNRMLEFFGGVPAVVVPDNLKSAVVRPGSQPELNRIYLEFARHYGLAIVPARVKHPQDKAKAEVGVQLAQRWILASLRHRRFFSVEDINVAIGELLPQLNGRPFRRFEGCRRSRFEQLDAPRLRALPGQIFEYAEWTSELKVGPDYHLYIAGHYYSVPYALVQSRVEARLTSHAVEVFHRGRRVASHVRSDAAGTHTTLPEHQPESHRRYSEQTPARVREWASSIGEATRKVVEQQFVASPHALLAMRACATLQRLARDHGAERFEAACARAQAIDSLTVKSVRSILQRRLEDAVHESSPQEVGLPLHHNVRGPTYYTSGGN